MSYEYCAARQIAPARSVTCGGDLTIPDLYASKRKAGHRRHNVVQRRGWALALALAFLIAIGLGTLPAAAQNCTADSQCRNSFVDRPTCTGDTLVTRRAYCSGTCRVEEQRRNCAVGASTRCTGGGTFERITGRCDALSGRCTQRRERDVCLPSCVCRGKLLIVSTGQCSSAIGCHKGVIRCRDGCRCSPEPQCIGGRADAG